MPNIHTRALALLAGLLLVSTPALNAQGPTPAKIRGDVDGDGKVTEADAQAVRAYLVGRPLPEGPSIMPAGDANGDGRVTAVDAAVISRFVAGADVSRFPVGKPEPGSETAGTGGGTSTAGDLFIAQLCEVDLVAGTFSCAAPAPQTGATRPDLVLGSPSVQLVSGGPATVHKLQAANEDTTQVPVRIRNLIGQPIGTSDGSTTDPDGIRVFFNTGPTVTAVSSGTIAGASIRMADADSASFTPPSGSPVYVNKKFYRYDEVVAQNLMTAAQTWRFVYSQNVTRFSYFVFISAPVRYEYGWIDVTPPSPAVGLGGTVTLSAAVRNELGNPVGDAVTWSSSNDGIATVNPSTGLVTGVAPGTVTITATSSVVAQRTGTAAVTVTSVESDVYPENVIGNVHANSSYITPTPFSVTANDQLAPGSEISFFGWGGVSGVTKNGGEVSMTTTDAGGTLGRFSYNPPAGFEGVDSLLYRVGSGPGDSAYVAIPVSGMIWFVNNDPGACASDCDGRLSNPFTSLAALQAVNDGSGNHPAPSDWIFLYESATPYAGPLTLLDTQKVVGQDVSLSLATLTGFTVPSGSADLPTTNTGDPNRAVIGGTNGIGLALSNSLGGISLEPSAGTGLGTNDAGTGFGTLNVNEVAIAATGTGRALDLDNGTVSATSAFTSVGSTGGTVGARLNNVSGTVALGAGAIGGSTAQALLINGGTATVTYGGAISNGTGRTVEITSRSAGNITLSGNLAGGGTGLLVSAVTGGTLTFSGASKQITTGGTDPAVTLTGNTGASIAFTGGGLAIVSDDGAGLSATGGGTLVVTGGANGIASSGGVALRVENTTIGSGGLTFRSISADGGSSGIVLDATGSTAGLSVMGDVAANSGGTIQNTTGPGISLSSTRDVYLDHMNIQNTGRSGINGFGVTNFTFAEGTVNNSGTSLQPLDSNIAFNGNNTGVGNSIAGTLVIANSTLTNAYDHGIDVEASDGTLTHLILNGNTITSSTSKTTSKGSGIRVNGTGTASTVFNLDRATIDGNVVTNFPSGSGIYVSTGNPHTSGPGGTGGIPGDATNRIVISNNRVRGELAASVTNSMAAYGIAVIGTGGNSASRSRGNFEISNNGAPGDSIRNMLLQAIEVETNDYTDMTGRVTGNLIAAHSITREGIGGGTRGLGPFAAATPILSLVVSGNSISSTPGSGILLTSDEAGQLNLRLDNNTVATPTASTFTARRTISIEAGTFFSADAQVCLAMTNNVVGIGLNGALGIGVRKTTGTPTLNDFGIQTVPQAAPTNAQVKAYLEGQNPLASGVDVLAGPGYTQCSTAPAP